MAVETENFKYLYPVEELDRILEEINNGITPMMNDQLQLELKIRYRELQDEVIEDSDDDDIKKHHQLVKEHIEKKKREATKHSITTIKLTEAQRQQLLEDVSSSIVRLNPNDPYNLDDDLATDSVEKKRIMERLAKLQNCYYNQIDYVNAINTIKDAIEYGLRTEYPWLSHDEGVRQFNKGDIKFKFCRLPKLYINYSTQITDPAILRGVVTGDITLKDKSDKPVKKKHKNEKAVRMDYDIIPSQDFANMLSYHKKGYDTPISLIVKSRSNIYNRYSLPNINNKQTVPIEFDWTQPEAGKRYFNLMHNKTESISDIIRDINKENDNMLNNVINSNVYEFFSSMRNIQPEYHNENRLSTSLEYNQEAAQIEQNILKAIRLNNPTV